ncbi:ATPase WRNIP1-like [Nasonia vitripennis]|uniref:AAA+ ATPase domain-containing protein n=1 Tax=Nasonia vitripennis TaxID=7425 RepID=A0A7M7TAG2_NASVI|nr:ATPase WRNIP1-like [Nasonia vitripennis]XP_031786918.1 ATPase WRNIP1-like [Nasonia vitripennis]
MSSQEEPAKIECPICAKEFAASVIEAHASKCLFLNESSSKSQETSKRASFFRGDNVAKKAKGVNFKGSTSPSTSSSTSRSKFLAPTIQENDSDKESSTRSKDTKPKDSIPLAEKMRPNSIMSYVGQKHVLGPETMLYQLLSKTEIPNIILWGPPGCGKTSLANVIANTCQHCPGGKYRYVKLSAAMSGISDVKDAITIASNELKFGRRTVMFMDEIHRFNKTQQDTFLPHIESGTIILIGATTENPSFSLNAALLSRCRVIVLEKLTIENLTEILIRAIKAAGGAVHDFEKPPNASINNKFFIDRETVKWLAETSDGDARIALGGLELAIHSKVPSSEGSSSSGLNFISLDDVKDSLKKTHMLYDKKGDQHYDMISALHKSVRASDDNAALYWITRMMAGGEDPVYIGRRLVRMATEDIGLEDPKALGVAVHTMQSCKMLGMPECDVLLAQCAIYLARAPKSRLMEDSLRAAQRVVANYKDAQLPVPLHLRNIPTSILGKKDRSALPYMPEEIKNLDFLNGQ